MEDPSFVRLVSPRLLLRRGHGHATEAVRAVVQYAFTRLAMYRLCAQMDARNVRAQRLLERLSFRREGEFREAV
jgi:RimJ/RimL family protein N-acetyltransferase